jgi:hypothetical protein
MSRRGIRKNMLAAQPSDRVKTNDINGSVVMK